VTKAGFEINDRDCSCACPPSPSSESSGPSTPTDQKPEHHLCMGVVDPWALARLTWPAGQRRLPRADHRSKRQIMSMLMHSPCVGQLWPLPSGLAYKPQPPWHAP